MRPQFAIVLFCCASIAFAQHTLDIHTLRLDLRDVDMRVDTVMLGFGPAAAIGASRVGLSPSADDVFFDQPTATALGDLMNRSLQSVGSLHHVTVKVNALRLEEIRSNQEEVGSCAVHLEFLVQKEDGWYRVYEQGTCLTDPAMNDPHGLEELLSACLEDLFQGCWSALTTGTWTNEPVALNASRTPDSAFRLPIMRDPAPCRGLYRSFQQFRANVPDTTVEFFIAPLRTGNGNPRRARLNLADASAPDMLWGFSDGARSYVNVGSYFIELMREGDRFTTVLPNPEAEREQLAFAKGGSMFMFGPLGAPFAGGMGGGIPFGPGPRNHAENLAMRMDLLTGRLGMTGIIAAPNVVTSRHYLLCSDKSLADQPVHVQLGDSLLAALNPGEFHEFTPEMQLDPLVLEVRSASGETQLLSLDTYRTDDQVFIIKVKKDGRLTVTEAGSQMVLPIIEDLKETNRARPRQ
ncbi:MAG: hypothetical protein ABI599_16585 [Flavobacteriales bacterium]